MVMQERRVLYVCVRIFMTVHSASVCVYTHHKFALQCLVSQIENATESQSF